jgi:hypothetical protein
MAQAEQQNNNNLRCIHTAQDAEVEQDDRSNEDLEQKEKLALRDQVCLASLVNQL